MRQGRESRELILEYEWLSYGNYKDKKNTVTMFWRNKAQAIERYKFHITHKIWWLFTDI